MPALPSRSIPPPGQQVLWRGLPLKTFGAAVYAKPEFVSTQPLTSSFRNRPDLTAVPIATIGTTCWKPAKFRAASTRPAGRRALLRQVVDMMLSPEDPYDALTIRQRGTTATVARS